MKADGREDGRLFVVRGVVVRLMLVRVHRRKRWRWRRSVVRVVVGRGRGRVSELLRSVRREREVSAVRVGVVAVGAWRGKVVGTEVRRSRGGVVGGVMRREVMGRRREDGKKTRGKRKVYNGSEARRRREVSESSVALGSNGRSRELIVLSFVVVVVVALFLRRLILVFLFIVLVLVPLLPLLRTRSSSLLWGSQGTHTLRSFPPEFGRTLGHLDDLSALGFDGEMSTKSVLPSERLCAIRAGVRLDGEMDLLVTFEIVVSTLEDGKTERESESQRRRKSRNGRDEKGKEVMNSRSSEGNPYT